MTTRLILLAVALVVAVAIGVALRRRDRRTVGVQDGDRLAPAELGIDPATGLGERATFLQFSSPACSPCRATARVLGEVVAAEPTLAHVEIDATQRLDLARRLDVMRTPTVLVLDPAGRVTARLSGVPSPERARAAAGLKESLS